MCSALFEHFSDQRVALDLIPEVVPPEVAGAPGADPLAVPRVPGVIPPEVEGEPAVGWGLGVPGVVPPEVEGVPGVVPPEVTGAPGMLPVSGAPGVTEVAGAAGEMVALGGPALSLTTSSGQGADGSVFSVAPVQRRATRSDSTPVVCAKTQPLVSSRAIDIERVAASARICRLLFTQTPFHSTLRF